MNLLKYLIISFLSLATQATAADFPFCTNGSDTGNGYGWDPAVTDPNGSHSCRVPTHQQPPSNPGIPGGGNSCESPVFFCGNGIVAYCWARAATPFHIAYCDHNPWDRSTACWVVDQNGKLITRSYDQCPAS